MIAGAVLTYATGVLDRAGLDGAGQGLVVGAAICFPIWLLGLWRRSRNGRDDRD